VVLVCWFRGLRDRLSGYVLGAAQGLPEVAPESPGPVRGSKGPARGHRRHFPRSGDPHRNSRRCIWTIPKVTTEVIPRFQTKRHRNYLQTAPISPQLTTLNSPSVHRAHHWRFAPGGSYVRIGGELRAELWGYRVELRIVHRALGERIGEISGGKWFWGKSGGTSKRTGCRRCVNDRTTRCR